MSEVKTSTYITMGIYDDTAKDDLTISVAGGLQSFSDLGNFTKDRVEWDKYATLEPGRTALDGTYTPFPDDMRGEWGIWSSEMTGQDGNLKTPIVITLSFKNLHACVGLTFHFDEPAGEWANKIYVQWIGENSRPIANATAEPDDANFFLQKRVDRFKKIIVTVYGTSKAYRYLKLANIDYGKLVVFDDSNIVRADIIEDISQTGEELASNQLEIDVYSDDEAYNILDPHSLTAGFRQRQRVHATEYINGVAVPQGLFYLSKWQATSEYRTSITAIDIIGVMGSDSYQGGIYNTTVAGILADVLSGFEYVVAPEIADLPIKGWLPTTTKRGALKEIAFACGGIIDTSIDGVIHIYPREERAKRLIGYGDKWLGYSSVNEKPTVTAIELTSYEYTKGSEESRVTLFDSNVSGDSITSFDAPHHDYQIEGGSIRTAHPNYVAFTGRGDVVITGIPYNDNPRLLVLENEGLPVDIEGNVVKHTGHTLVSPNVVYDVADNLIRYHNQNLTIVYRKVLAPDERLASTQEVMSFFGRKVRGNVERMSKSLSHGYYADVTLSGYQVRNDFVYYLPEVILGGGALL